MNLADFIAILADELQLPGAEITADAALEGLGVQSIDVIQVVQRVELALGRSVGDLDIAEVETVAQLHRALVGTQREVTR
ncbi:MAG: acyl carrier protein, partial [Myxococcales bacterium]|nr:acyl carrier protein [Myxococcales bacterium]